MSNLELRPRLATEIVDAAFQLYRRHFRTLITVSTAVYAPYILLEFVLGGGRVDGSGLSPVAALFLPLVGWILGSFAEAVIVVAVSNSYLHGEPELAGAMHRTRSRFGTVLFAVLAKWMFIGLGFALGMVAAMVVIMPLMFLMPGGDPTTGVASVLIVVAAMVVAVPIGLRFYASYFAVPATVMLEGLGVGAGLRRSRELSRDFKLKVCGALGLPMILFLAIQLTVMTTAMLLPGPAIIKFLLAQAPTLLISPILAVIATLLYYDARIRKEGFDIEVMAAELGSNSPTGSPPHAPVSPA